MLDCDYIVFPLTAEYVVELLKAEDLSPVSKLIENGFPLAGMEINKDDLPEAATQLLDTCGGLTVSHSILTMHMHTKSYKTIILLQKKLKEMTKCLNFKTYHHAYPEQEKMQQCAA